jgi:hypothetical protein
LNVRVLGAAGKALALVSHLLFLYSDQLDFNFHQSAVEELLRVAREVRIFPLLTLEQKPSPHVGPIHTHLTGRGWRAEIAVVPYEFQRGGNEMLRIRAAGSSSSYVRVCMKAFTRPALFLSSVLH